MKKSLRALVMLSIGISCSTIAMQHHQPMQYIPHTNLTPKERKLLLAENKLAQRQVELCAQILQTSPNGPVIAATDETRKNAALYLHMWSSNLHVNGYTIAEWNTFERTAHEIN